MDIPQIAAVVIMVLFVMAVLKARRKRGKIFGQPGPGAAGAIYDMLNEDKRKAIEIIVEEKAEARLVASNRTAAISLSLQMAAALSCSASF